MKRVLILLVTLLFGLTLAACDNFQQIQEFSREYCEQNPNDEVCQLESIDNLTEAEVLQLFNGVLENYNDAAYANFCDEYFSVTNTVLLDDCREATTNLVPDGFEGFSELTYDGDASNNYYVIIGITSDGLNEVEFRIQVVLEDGGYLISYWQFTSTPVQVTCDTGYILENGNCVPEPLVCDAGFTLIDGECVEDVLVCDEGFTLIDGECIEDVLVCDEGYHEENGACVLDEITECPTGQELVDGVCLPVDPLEVSYDEAKAFLQEFIDMYLDPAIPSDDFCHEYFVFDPEGCIEDRDEGHAEGANIILDEVLDLEDGIFGALMTFFDPENEEGRPQYQKFLLTKDTTGNILIEFLDNDVPLDVAAEVFTNLLMDFQNPDISIEEIAMNYFMGDIPENIARDRDKILEEGIVYDVTGWYENEHGEYVLQFTMTFPDGTEEIEVPFKVYEYSPGMYVIDVRDDDGYDPDQEDFIYAMIDEYLVPTIPSIDWCDMYFGPEAEEDCVEDRDETIARADVSINIMYIDWRDGMMVLGLEIFEGTETMQQEMGVEFIYDEMGNILYVRFHENMGDPDQEAFIYDMINSYLDPNLTSVDWCNKYFGPEAEMDCAEDRDETLTMTDVSIQIMFIEWRDGMMYLGLEMYDGTEYMYPEMAVEFIYDENGNIMYVKFHENMGDPQQEDFIRELFETYLDPDWDSIGWCDKFFGPDQEGSCAEDRDEALQNPDFFISLQWTEYHDGMMRIGIEMSDGVEQKYEELFVEFVYDEFGIWFVRFNPGQMIDPEWQDFLYNMVEDFNTFDIPSQEVCEIYFEGENEVQGCIDKREELVQANGHVQIEYIHAGPYGIEVGFRWFMNEGDYMEDVLAHFYYNEFNELKVQFEGRHHYQFDWQEAEGILDELLFDFNDQALNDADFCYKWFSQLDSTNCFLERQMYMGANYFAVKDWMDYGDQGFRVGLRIELPDTSEEHHYEIMFAPYYDENGELQIHWWYYHPGYDHDEAQNLVEGFIRDAFDPSFTDDDLFNMYSRGDYLQMNEIRNHLLSLNITSWNFTRFDFNGHDAYIEILVWDDNGGSWHEYFYVEFYDEDGMLFLNIYYSEPYNDFPEHEAKMHLEWVINLFNDRAVSQEDACMYMPRIIEDCYAYRQEMFNLNYNLMLHEFWVEHGSTFGANIEFIDFTTGTPYYQYFSFNFWYNSDMTIGMQMNEPMQPFVWADYTQAQDLWTQWVTDYQDPNFSNQDFADKWFFGHYQDEFFQGREDQMAAGVTYVMVDFIDDGGMGPWAYRFIIEHHVNGEVMVQEDYVMFRLFEDGTFQIEFNSQHGPNIDFNEAVQIIDTFFWDLRDEFMSTGEICDLYFPMDSEANCIYVVENIFRMYSDSDYFYFEHYNDHFDMGVDFYNDLGEMIHTTYFYVYFMEGPNGEWFFDLEEHPDHYWEQQWFMDYMDNFQFLIDEYQIDAAILPQLCDMYFYTDPLCGEFDQFFTPELVDAHVTGYWWEDENDTNINYYVDLHFDYTDGTFIRVKYLIYFEVDSADIMHATLEEVGRQGSAPTTAILQDPAMTDAVLTEFGIDYSDPNVDAIGMCNVYFNDMMMDAGCLEGRDEFLQQQGIAVFLYADEYADENGVPYFEAFFELTENGTTETVNAMVRVYQLLDGRYFIEFMDMYDDNDYIDYDMFYDFIFEFIAAYNDPANTDEYICIEFYDWTIGDYTCEPDRQTMLAQGSMLVLISMNEDYWVGDQPTFIIEFEYVNNDPALNMAYVVQYQPFYDTNGEIALGYAPPMP